jgi:hypothetical protein
MNTKQVVWNFFQKNVLAPSKNSTKKTINFIELMTLIHNNGHVYDNRTAKNYIDCMVDNGWLISPEPINPLENYGQFAITSVYRYKRTTWQINENATFESENEDKILKEIFPQTETQPKEGEKT